MLWVVLRQIFGLELRPVPSEAWLMAGRAPGTCSREPPPLEPREDMEPAGHDEADRDTSIQGNKQKNTGFLRKEV